MGHAWRNLMKRVTEIEECCCWYGNRTDKESVRPDAQNPCHQKLKKPENLSHIPDACYPILCVAFRIDSLPFDDVLIEMMIMLMIAMAMVMIVMMMMR